MKEIERESKALFEEMIKKREKDLKQGECQNDDLLSLLIDSNFKEVLEHGDSESVGLTIDEIIAECKLFYFAGQETTYSLLVWAMVLLGMHQEWQERAREEVLQVFGRSTEPDFDGLSKLKIVTIIIYEVLRLYPPFVMLTRLTHEKVKVGEVTLPQGVEIGLPILLVHHDRDIWGEDVQEFRPERFAEGVSKAMQNRISFFPFSWGPRICIGQNFALVEAKMALVMILQHFSFKLSTTYVHAPYTVVTLQPQYGAQIILVKQRVNLDILSNNLFRGSLILLLDKLLQSKSIIRSKTMKVTVKFQKQTLKVNLLSYFSLREVRRSFKYDPTTNAFSCSFSFAYIESIGWSSFLNLHWSTENLHWFSSLTSISRRSLRSIHLDCRHSYFAYIDQSIGWSSFLNLHWSTENLHWFLAVIVFQQHWFLAAIGLNEVIGDVRGRGLMLGVELVTDRHLKTPAKTEILHVMEQMKDVGVLIGKGGFYGNVFRITPPLCFTKEDAGNPAMASYPHNYGRFEYSHYYNVNGVGMLYNEHQFSNMHSFVQQVEVCEICKDYSRSTYDCPYYPKYENYHYPSYASPQPDFFGFMSSPQIPQQSTSLEDMMKKLLDDQRRFHEELQQFSREFPSLQNLENQFIQVNATLQNMLDEKELCNTQPTSYSEENVEVDMLSNVEENVDTPVENYWCETTQGFEVLQIEPDMPIAPNDDDDVALEIGVISERPEEPQIESKEDQTPVLVKPPTLPCIFVKPYTGVEVKERSRIFYTADTLVLDDHDSTDSFVLEVPNELPILKEGVHAALPNYGDAPFVVDISKGESIT
ncbi:hypothetical protein Syun_027435 [Stephania yunnanensis]|uniref:Cytochrome P450 n=1 Tax=Stephania yunnanensis TaxID=152371 RepID=A0AAP0EFX4_9MAGN